jgi:hypothetical protein
MGAQQPAGENPATGKGQRRHSKSSRKKARVKQAPENSKVKRVMNLATLADGMPGLTPAHGQTLAEAAAVCLESQNHQPGVKLACLGLMAIDVHVEWLAVDEQSRRSHADMQEATEWGAAAVAILLTKEITGKVVVERSAKGTGFDYWLGDGDYEGLPFVNGMARLEVSGILTGTTNQIDSRIRQKKDQMIPTDHVAPGFAAVVEFGTPIARVESK